MRDNWVRANSARSLLMRVVLTTALAVAASTLLLIQTTASAASAPPAAKVVTDAVTELETAPLTWTPGTVLSHTDAKLGSEVAGLVTWVADVGTTLAAGQPVAKFNDELLRLALTDSEAAVRGLEKRLVFLRSEAARLDSLASVSSAAQSQLDRSVADRDVAIENLAQARAKAASNRYRLRQASVVAPFNGQIVQRLVVEGEYVNVGQPLARMVDVSRVEVRSQAPLRVAPYVRNGMIVPIRYNDKLTELEVTAVIPIGDLESRTFEIRLQLDQQDWVIGTSVQVGLPTSLSRRILTVHRDALVLRESGAAVFVIKDDTVRRLPVETGIGADARIELLDSGLQPGDKVVIRGAELLRDGQKVRW